MSNHHYEKWLYKTPLGIILIAGGIFFMYYTLTQVKDNDRWVFFGLTSAISVALGAFFLASGAINKMKSDLIKKQKIKQMSG